MKLDTDKERAMRELDMEQERKDFAAAVRKTPGLPTFAAKATDLEIVENLKQGFAGWCAAKRAARSAGLSQEPVATIRFERSTPGMENEMPSVVSCKWLPDGEYSLYTAPPAPVSAEPVLYRCFHCHEEFHDVESAGLHFGRSQVFDPACAIDIARFREMEQRMISYNEEDADIHQHMAGLRNQHALDLRREEEKGYARGLRDAVKYPDEVVTAAPLSDAEDAEPTRLKSCRTCKHQQNAPDGACQTCFDDPNKVFPKLLNWEAIAAKEAT